jgi:hypothetical protein
VDILFHVGSAAGGKLLLPLARACQRRGATFAAFFTHDGVAGLADAALREALGAAERAVVCEESWNHHCPGTACPVELGSQTVNSALMGEARKVVSL